MYIPTFDYELYNELAKDFPPSENLVHQWSCLIVLDLEDENVFVSDEYVFSVIERGVIDDSLEEFILEELYPDYFAQYLADLLAHLSAKASEM